LERKGRIRVRGNKAWKSECSTSRRTVRESSDGKWRVPVGGSTPLPRGKSVESVNRGSGGEKASLKNGAAKNTILPDNAGGGTGRRQIQGPTPSGRSRAEESQMQLSFREENFSALKESQVRARKKRNSKIPLPCRLAGRIE